MNQGLSKNRLLSPLHALSPLDGRYSGLMKALSTYFSEAALIRYRLKVEGEWLIYLLNTVRLAGSRILKKKELEIIYSLCNPSSQQLERVKMLEQTTRHDVKAVEYFMREVFEQNGMQDVVEWIHFGCTSEDINNLAYGMMLSESKSNVLMACLNQLSDGLMEFARKGKSVAMLAHTHGQPASPTTVGKEFTNVYMRLKPLVDEVKKYGFSGKMNGAVGNWNAHAFVYPKLDWVSISSKFIQQLGLSPLTHTTQIEPHDQLAAYFYLLMRLNTVLIDLNQDIWLYVSKNYFVQKVQSGEVGSSTMPHKVNPIDFENSEGNLGLANALLDHLARKLPISRMQRDLTDSTVLRNIGVTLGHCVLAYQSALKGFGKLEINRQHLEADLNAHWEILGEPLQMVMRRYGLPNPYETLKQLTRGKSLTHNRYVDFVGKLKIPTAEKKRLLELTPAKYIGLAEELSSLRKQVSGL